VRKSGWSCSLPLIRRGDPQSQLLDLLQPVFAIESEPHQILMEHLACQIGIQTREPHTFRDNGAGHDLPAVKRTERWNSWLDVHFCAVLAVIQGLDNDVHVIELPR